VERDCVIILDEKAKCQYERLCRLVGRARPRYCYCLTVFVGPLNTRLVDVDVLVDVEVVRLVEVVLVVERASWETVNGWPATVKVAERACPTRLLCRRG
jgi:hypothetical protein